MASKPGSWPIQRVGTCQSAPFVNEMSIAAGSTGSRIISRRNRTSSMHTNSNGSPDHPDDSEELAQAPLPWYRVIGMPGGRITQDPTLWTAWHSPFKGSRILALIVTSFRFRHTASQNAASGWPWDDRTRGDPAWMTN